MKIYLPFTGEFGGELLRVAPAIHGDPGPKVVCCEEGKECLYPSADEIHVIERPIETMKATIGSKNDAQIFETIKKKFGPLHQYIEPLHIHASPSALKWFSPQVKYDYKFYYDVVVFPRYKTYQGQFNWDGWDDLLAALSEAKLSVFAAGHRDATKQLLCRRPWNYPFSTDLDVTIWALKHSKVRIGPLTALHVLSQMCGQPSTVLIASDGWMHPNVKKKPHLNYLNVADHKKVGYNVLQSFKIQDIVDYVVNITTK